MRKWNFLVSFIGLLAWAVQGAEFAINENDANSRRCGGMYSKASWGGDVDPFILVSFMKQDNSNALISLVLYEYADFGLLGRVAPDSSGDLLYICDSRAIQYNFCNTTQMGEFIFSPNAAESSKNPIFTKAIHLDSPVPIKYPVTRTGYYCLATLSNADKYQGIVEFRNAYGELPAAQIAKMPFYGGLTLVYAVMGIFWGFLYVQNRHDILAVQNYITAIIIFLVVEMLMTWGFYDYQNVHGDNVGAKVFMIIVSILNAARNSFSFFLLLIVCMGYGVVKPSLGRTMIYVRGLGGLHFVFGVIYAIASMNLRPEDAGPLVLLVIVPLSSTLTAFYIWTLNSLNFTMKDLIERKQHVKAAMYRKLWYCILVSIVVIFGFFFFNSFTFVSVGNDDFPATHWQTRWFVLDGWLNLVYLADVAYVAYLWRPTANNRRFAMSDEIAQDDEGFEINSIRDSLDDSDVENHAGGGPKHTPPDSDLSNNSAAEAVNSTSRVRRDESPLPAPKPTRPANLPRESLDGETIFAVGEDDKWSDDEDVAEERKGLVSKR